MPSQGLSTATLQNIVIILAGMAAIASAAPSILERPDLDYLNVIGISCASIFFSAWFALGALAGGRMNGEMLLTVLALFLIMGGCLAIVLLDRFGSL